MAASTPSAPRPVARLEQAIASIDDYFRGSSLSVRRLPQHEATIRHGSAAAAWRITIPFWDRQRAFDIVADVNCPYSRPLIYLADRPPLPTWPHVERDGKLCLPGVGVASFPAARAADVLDEQLRAAHRLIDESSRGIRHDDFLTEWRVYWSTLDGPSGPPLHTLFRMAGPSRLVDMWRASDFYLLADSVDALTRWRERVTKPTADIQPTRAALIWLERPLYPEEYPKETTALRRIAGRRSKGGLGVLDELATGKPEPLVAVLATRYEERNSAVGFVVTQPGSLLKKKGDRRAGVVSGFRPNRVPSHVLKNRYLASSPGLRSGVVRLDAAWLHGRDMNSDVESLQTKKVLLIGCGSLGASVARLLVQAGVGSIKLVDGDAMESANASRHLLGADSVNENKAMELGKRLSREFPHLIAVDAVDLMWQDAFRKDPRLFVGCDLVVAATGDWNSDSALNDLQRAQPSQTPTIVYSWLEESAAAAHAVVLGRTGSCFRCGHDDLGRLLVPAASFPPRSADEGQCGAAESPHGAAALSFAQGLAAETCIDVLTGRESAGTHRTWLATASQVQRAGGAWSAAWLAKHGAPEEGGRIVRTTWASSSACPACGAQPV